MPELLDNPAPAETSTGSPPAESAPAGGDGGGENLLAGKFKSPEELEKGYKELEKRMGDASPQPDGGPPQVPTVSPASIDDIVTRAGLTSADITSQWSESGSLSDDQYQAFEKQGYSREVVDTFITGQAANAKILQSEQVHIRGQAEGIVGGKDQLDNLLQWAAGNFDAGRVADLNERLGDPQKYIGAVHEINAEHIRAVGAGGSNPLVSGGVPSTQSSGGFTSSDDYLNGLKKLRNSGYQDKVLEAKLKATPRAIVFSGGK